jgi:hypothetical protein
MDSREQGREQGIADARAAWCGLVWKRTDIKPPANHYERWDYMMGYAAGVAEYTRNIHTNVEP